MKHTRLIAEGIGWLFIAFGTFIVVGLVLGTIAEIIEFGASLV